ncbi:hypothetical protein ACJX0J_032046 [Zea mays]
MFLFLYILLSTTYTLCLYNGRSLSFYISVCCQILWNYNLSCHSLHYLVDYAACYFNALLMQPLFAILCYASGMFISIHGLLQEFIFTNGNGITLFHPGYSMHWQL